MAYESDEGHRIEYSGQQMEDVALRNRRANFGNAPWNPLTNVYDTTRTVHSLRYENVNGFGLWDPSATLGFSENEIGSISSTDSTVGITRTYTATIKNKFHLSDNNSITAGLDYQDQKSTASGSWLGSNTPFEQNETIGIFAQARLEPTGRLKISTGLRYDWSSFIGQDFAQSGSAFEDDSSGASGNLSLVYDVTDELSLRGAYSNVFGGYRVEDNFLFYQTWDYSGMKPSRANNVVLGADWQGGAWTFGGEIFQTQIDNTRSLTGAAVDSYDFESRGFNLGATYGWTDGFARFTFSQTENYVDGEKASGYYLLDSGAPLGSVLSLQVQQEISRWNTVVGAHVDAALTYDSGATDDPDVQEMPGYEVLNLFAEYTPPSYENVTIRASIDNVFDRTYSDRATYGGDYDGFPTLNEPGRNLRLEASVKF